MSAKKKSRNMMTETTPKKKGRKAEKPLPEEPAPADPALAAEEAVATEVLTSAPEPQEPHTVVPTDDVSVAASAETAELESESPAVTDTVAETTDAPTSPPEAPAATAEAPAREPRRKKAERETTPQKLSGLDAAAKVLAEAGEPMTCKAMIEAMAAKGYWSSPHGKTPDATLYAAIIKEISTKRSTTRFEKTGRGQFALREDRS